MAINVALAFATLGMPIADMQGNWWVISGKIREPENEAWVGFSHPEHICPVWRVQGTGVEVSVAHTNRKTTKTVSADPNAFPIGGPNGVRFIDDDGVSFTGSYTLKDGNIELSLLGNVPGKGSKEMTIQLVRPKPAPQPLFQPGISYQIK